MPTELEQALAPLVAELAAVRRELATLRERLGDRLLTQKEAAARRGVSTRTIRQLEAEARLVRVTGTGQPRYTPEAVDSA